jgi:poly-gamma-glutamate biosynthesis protein PgsC/CapC
MNELFLIALVIGFLFYEFVGISPGGVIAPAYLALFVTQPSKIFMTLAIAVVVYFLIRFFASRLILYGRRKFLIAIILGFFLKLFIAHVIQPNPSINFNMHSIGYIIPGLIAHEMGKQEPVSVLLSLGIVASLIYQLSYIIR